jgi:hypothetical protein
VEDRSLGKVATRKPRHEGQRSPQRDRFSRRGKLDTPLAHLSRGSLSHGRGQSLGVAGTATPG